MSDRSSRRPDGSGRHVLALDWRAPDAAFRSLSSRRLPVWLDSAGPVGPRSRFSYLCVDPVSVLEYRDGVLRHDGRVGEPLPFQALADLVSRARRVVEPGPAPFMGGVVGLLGYGLGTALERLPARHAQDPDLPALWFGHYDLVLAFDRLQRRCWLISTGNHPDQTALERAALLLGWLDQPPVPLAPIPKLTWHPDRTQESYVGMIERTLDYIRAGDIFQANLTMRHVAVRADGVDPASVHLALRARNPAAFGAYIGWGQGRARSSASPERFLSLDARGTIETRPIKGTRPRCDDAAADACAAQELARSEKDRAENLMIVDLMRNDLSRVAVPGSVAVPALFEIESIATLHHLVSTVTARLRPDEDAITLLRATFPGGSVTGAPKIRAMQIIDLLELSSRGPYCGSVVWIGEDGAMDSSIVIRTLMLGRATIVAQAGGGIVADSDPIGEYREMLSKVAPLLSVFA
jgi:para-aminobenzoate synthetase component 1